jgi:hypothetical protein
MDDKPRFIKDPDAKLDYGFDWDDWLASVESISTVNWSVPEGLTKVSEQDSGSVAKVWISGGTVGTEYTVRCRLTTSAGRIDDRSFIIEVQER